LLCTPSVFPTETSTREPPRKRIFQDDQLDSFKRKDIVKSIDDLDHCSSPPGFEFRRFENSVLYYRIHFDETSDFPTILESIRVNEQLNVQLQYNGVPLPLPPWFVKGRNARLDKRSMLENFPPFMRSAALENENILLDELKQRTIYKPKGRPPFSAALIRFSLHLRYTSLQAYKLLLEKFPLTFIIFFE